MTWIVLIALSVVPTPDIGLHVEEQVDVIEVNHLYDHEGRHIIDQLIFYEWSGRRDRYDVRAWRKLRCRSQHPVKDWRTGRFRVTWYEGTLLRVVEAPSRRETWTTYDPEVLERDILPVGKRRELVSPRRGQWPRLGSSSSHRPY